MVIDAGVYYILYKNLINGRFLSSVLTLDHYELFVSVNHVLS